MTSSKSKLILSTALISVLAVGTPQINAEPKTEYSNHQEVNEGDSPISIAGKGINFLVSQPENMKGPKEAEHMSFVKEAELIDNNLKDCRQVVRSSQFLNHLNTFKQFEAQHMAQFKKSLNRRPLSDTGDQANPLIEKISLQLFKSSKNYLQNAKNRSEFEKDSELGGLFTFTLNKNKEISVFVDDLSMCIPFFKGFKSGLGVEHLIPDGQEFSLQQRQQALFVNNILSHYPDFPLKKGLVLIKKHPQENSEGLWNLLTGKNLKELPSTINYDEAYGKLKRVWDYHRVAGVRQLQEGNETQILQRALTRIRWNWDLEAHTGPVSHAWEEVVGKPWSFYTTSSQTLQDINLTLIRTLQYHAGRRVPDYENLKDFEQKEVIRVARNLYLKGEETRHKDKPDTSELNRAISVFKTYPL